MPKTADAATPVALYARYSTSRQDARSIEDQVRRCRAYASERGFRVVAEFSDAAVSGAHVDRAGMQALLSTVAAKGATIRAVLVDDLSRLSRDIGDTFRIIFSELASANVHLIDVTTRMSSQDSGARLTFGALALVNDTFRQMVCTETHRGLEGRALGGFWTGGRCFGYATVQEENAPDPDHPRKRPVIHPDQAALVVRVFEMFVAGAGLKRIAATLNADRIPGPNDGGRGNKIGDGWQHSTIRAMLLNERYLGIFRWNLSKWVRVPGRKSRKRIMRGDGEVIVREDPTLAIIPQALWDAAQAKFQRRAQGSGRPPGTGKHVHLVSGLLRCGVCGGNMTIVGRRKKGDGFYARFGCTAHASRGDSICANGLSVSEKKVSRALVSALREKLAAPRVVDRFVATFQKRAAAAQRSSPDPANDHARRVRDCQQRVANLTEALANAGWSDALAAKLRDEEAQLAQLKACRPAPSPARTIPHSATIAAYLQNLWRVLEADPSRARELLSRYVAPILMTPETEGAIRGYRATGAFNLNFFLQTAASNRDLTKHGSLARVRRGGERRVDVTAMVPLRPSGEPALDEEIEHERERQRKASATQCTPAPARRGRGRRHAAGRPSPR